MRKIYAVVILFLLVSLFEIVSEHKYVYKQLLKYDASGYYLYLPATIIYKDLKQLKFYKQIDSLYHPSDIGTWYGVHDQPLIQQKTIKYAIGTAISELPFFLIADAYCSISKQYPRDGYSMPYQFSVAMSTLIWVVLGLFILGKLLLQFFDANTAAITLILIAFGTNLYCNTSEDMGMSHSFVFALYSFIIYCTHRFYTRQNNKYPLLLGLLLGWVLMSRPVDFIIIIIPLLWPLPEYAIISNINRFTFWRARYKQLFLCAISAIIVASVQLFYWKYTTGHFLHYSYQGEGFDFRHSKILDGLFSYRKGWFVYTPIALIAILGFIPLFKYHKKLVVPLILFLCLMIYVVFSWEAWMYGWSFGCRALVESLVVLAIPLAAIVHFIRSRNWLIKSISATVFLFLIWLNIYQTHQYTRNILDGYRMTKSYYWRIFGHMQVTDEDKRSLMQ